MGCLVAKSTISYYEEEIHRTSRLVSQIKDQIENRRMQHELFELANEEQLGYLAYQEQLRISFIESKLNELFPINSKPSAYSDSYKANFSSYSHLKSLQTEYETQLIDEIFNFLGNVVEMNKSKKSELDTEIKKLLDKNFSKFFSSENILHKLSEVISDNENFNSFRYFVESFVKRSEVDRELALVQRIYEFREFISKEGLKRLDEDDGTETLNLLKTENKELAKELAGLKAEEVKLKKTIKVKNKEIRKKEEILNKMMEDMQEIDEELKDNPDIVRDFEELLQKVTENEMKMKELMEKVDEAEGRLEKIRFNQDFDELRQKSRLLKRQIEEAEQKIESLKGHKMKAIQDRIKMKHQSLEDKTKSLRDMRNYMKAKQEALIEAERNAKFDIKKQIFVRLFRSIKKLRTNYFRYWKKLWLESKLSLKHLEDSSLQFSAEFLKVSTYWEPEKLYDFFDELVREKVRSDKARIHNRKLPKTLKKFLSIYMKRLYTSTNECEKEINKMIQTINSEEKTDPLASIIKKMIGEGQVIHYHLDILLTQLWSEFNYYGNQDTKEKTCPLFDAIKILKDYLGSEYSVAGQKLIQKWKPDSMENEDYILIILKYFMVSYDRDYLLRFQSSEELVSFLSEQVKIFICPEDIQNIFSDVLGVEVEHTVKYLTMNVSNVDETELFVNKSEFLLGIIEVFDEFLLQGKLTVEKMLRSIEDLTSKDFENIIKKLEPGLEAVYIKKILSECVIDESSNLYSVSGENLADVIIKYGVGGVGVGPFMTVQLRSLLDQYLKKEVKTPRDRRQSSDLVPYKISVQSIEAEKNQQNPNLLNVNNSSILNILPSKNIKIQNVRRILSPSPTPGNRSIPKIFFSSRGNTPVRGSSRNSNYKDNE